MTRQADRIQGAERSGLDQPARLAVAGVETPLEAELEWDPAALDLAGDGERVVEVGSERLLAERRQAAPDRGADEVGVRGRGRRDDDGLGGVQGGLDRRRGRGAHLRRHGGGAGRVDIGDDHAIDTRRGNQEPAMKAADATGPQQCDLHRPPPHHRFADSPRVVAGPRPEPAG